VNLLVTGFEPLAGLSHNPSSAILELLPEHLQNHQIIKARLPVDTRRAPEELAGLYRAYQPVAAIHLGLAVNRPLLSLERLAVNLLDFETPDNAGARPQDQTILPQAPLALASRLPLRKIQSEWRREGIPGLLSNSAGTYLCNQVMFLALAWLPQGVPTGFIHLPPDETLALHQPQAYLPLSTQAKAVSLAIQTTLSSVQANSA
jgi:pyroglutamyl-peptidase